MGNSPVALSKENLTRGRSVAVVKAAEQIKKEHMIVSD
jgi:hypothetical protein